MCCDISRTWFIGDGQPTDEMKRVHDAAHRHIVDNMALLKPGVTFKELSFGGDQLADEFVDRRYGVKMHGAGLCDEYPSIKYPYQWDEKGLNGVIEEGMVICVEAYHGTVGGEFGIKLEDQVLITADGHENLTKLPFDDKLMGREV
jgi:Xaa-Pro aminopeptidase